jgi:ribosome-binding protein aMBF1 (putative translation factor)
MAKCSLCGKSKPMLFANGWNQVKIYGNTVDLCKECNQKLREAILESGDKIIEIYRSNNQDKKTQVKTIGSALDNAGGFLLMQMVHAYIEIKDERIADDLAWTWNNVGEWQH